MIISESNLLHYIQSNFTDSLTLNDLTATFYISKKRISDMIRNATGRSFSQYLIDVRLEEAVNLLRNTELPIAEVALRSGFSSNSVFSQIFHKRYQMSPSSFRQHLEIKKTGSLDETVQITGFTNLKYHHKCPIGIVVGSISQLANYNFQQQLLHTLRKLNTKRIVINGFFFPDNVIGSSLQSFDDLTFIKAAFDFITSHQLEPIIQLSIKPRYIKSNNQTVVINEIPQISSDDFVHRRLVQLLTFIKNLYPTSTISKWRFLFWYDPVDTNSPKQFSLFYQKVYQLIKQILPKVNVGAGSFVVPHDLNNFHIFCQKYLPKLPLDFITCDFIPDFSNSRIGSFKESFSSFAQIVQECNVLVQQTRSAGGQKHLPFLISSFSLSASDRNIFNDSLEKGALLLQFLLQTTLYCDELYIYAFSDYSSAFIDTHGPMWGGNAIVSRDGFFKPSCFALYFQQFASTSIIASGSHYVAYQIEKDHYCILFFNPTDLVTKYFNQAESLVSSFNLQNLYQSANILKLQVTIESSQTMTATSYYVDEHHGNPLSLLNDLVVHNIMSNEDAAWINAVNHPQRKRELLTNNSGMLEFKFTAQPHSFGLIEIKPFTEL